MREKIIDFSPSFMLRKYELTFLRNSFLFKYGDGGYFFSSLKIGKACQLILFTVDQLSYMVHIICSEKKMNS